MTDIVSEPRRRLLLSAGGGLLLWAGLTGPTAAEEGIDIVMSGTPTGTHVWFRARGLWVASGQNVRWVNKDTGNVHTVTAYHPDNGKPLRIPAHARSWNSGYLMPEGTFEIVFEEAGVYDYYCIPHEQAGMVGRIVVGDVDASVRPYADTDGELPDKALENMPDVGRIQRDGRVD